MYSIWQVSFSDFEKVFENLQNVETKWDRLLKNIDQTFADNVKDVDQGTSFGNLIPYKNDTPLALFFDF